jgi:predicted nucleotidyltransferase
MSEASFGLSESVIDRVRGVLESHLAVESAIIYGSRAKGNFKPGSDIDLTLTGENLTTNDLLKISGELDDLLLPYTIDLSLFHQIENPDLVSHIKRVGRDFFIRL